MVKENPYQAQMVSQDLESTASPKSTPGGARRAVIQVLADRSKPMTIQDIERAVGQIRPMLVRDSIEGDVESLLNEGMIASTQDARHFQLTDRGLRFASGIEALAAG